MSNFVAYTQNADNSINVLAGSTNPAVFTRILPEGTTYEVHEGETYTAGGKIYLSNTDPAYIEAKAKEEKAKAITALDTQYNSDKVELSAQYTDAIIHNDTETADAIKEEMQALDSQYDEDYRSIIEEE